MKTKRKKIPKTGLAERIRAWASRQREPFSPSDMCYGLDLSFSDERKRARGAIRDFLARGEMRRVGEALYQYNQEWAVQARSSLVKTRLIKAMYVAWFTFTAGDLMRWTDARGRKYVEEVLLSLVRSGYVARVGSHKVPFGRENVYQVPDRDRFRKELM
ncbi:MAG: hypothetical protein PVG49_20940 [Desulfobacteraceae bacterium]